MSEFLIGSSGGNDSIALMQMMHETGHDFAVAYNNTGWSRKDWPERMKRVADWCFARGVTFYETKSEGMEALVRRKKGWPMPASSMQFCTMYLKEIPNLELMDRVDPHGDLVFVTGRRREESQNRRDLALWEAESEKHGGRDVWNPLVAYDEAARDELILRAGFEVLPHQSMECYPCVCANKSDLSAMPLDDDRITEIEVIEVSMGHTKNGKPRTMFRPYRVGGGVGIRQAVEWGHGPRGWKAPHFPALYVLRPGEATTEAESDIAYDESTKAGKQFARQCDGGYCGN